MQDGDAIDGRVLWQFLEKVKGWRFTGKGYDVRGPGEDGCVMAEDQLPQYVAGHPSLMTEYTKWKKGREAANAQHDKNGQKAKTADQKQSARPSSSPTEKNPTPSTASSSASASPSSPSPPVATMGRNTDSKKPPSTGPCGQVDTSPAGNAASLSALTATAPSPLTKAVLDASPAAFPAASAGSEGASDAAAGRTAAVAVAATSVAVADSAGGCSSSSSGNHGPKKSSPALRRNEEEVAPQAGEDSVQVLTEVLQHLGQDQRTQAGEQSFREMEVESGDDGDRKAKEKGQTTVENREFSGDDMADDLEVVPRPAARDRKSDHEDGVKEGARKQEAVAEGAQEEGVKATERAESAADSDPAPSAAKRAADVAMDSGRKMDEGKAGRKKGAAGVVQERVPAGPCLCPNDCEEGHKTVDVERRCWPGSNKPGGVGRITKKFTAEEEVCGEIVEFTFYDVKYLLGGSEKGIKETFISCTPLETEARQAAPREMFTVEVPEPSRRQRTSKPATQTRTSPLAPTVDNKSSKHAPASTLPSPKKKARNVDGSGAAKKIQKVKRQKPATERERDGGPVGERDGSHEAKRSKKRARIAAAEGGGEGSERKGASAKGDSKENYRAGQPRQEGPVRHEITDLSVVVEAKRAPKAPLPDTRMNSFQEALGKLFRQSGTDMVSLEGMPTCINAQLEAGTTPFTESERGLALKYLADEEKIMVDSGVIYRI
ncbi:unnamed protein product [Scytosiphon promiscuus]